MKQIKVRNQILGQGLPKICIPLMGRDMAQLMEAAQLALEAGADMYELRADFLEAAVDEEKVVEALKRVRHLVEDRPLIFTLRSEDEGGKQTLSHEKYIDLNLAVIESGLADILDVELSRGEETIKQLLSASHQKGMFVLLSNHIFEGTPASKEIISILCRMQQLGADITKLAVMAKSEADVLVLLDATLAMKEQYGDRPFITVSMGQKGILSRVAGGLFGSVLTYARGSEPSAPGQLQASCVRYVLELLYQKGFHTSK
jgi:3-dehydroquinate dehydratase-1